MAIRRPIQGPKGSKVSLAVTHECSVMQASRLPETLGPGLIRGKSVDNFSGQSLNPAVMLMSSGIR
jgi:hypothetical protein